MSEHLLTWAAHDSPRWEQARVEIGLGRLRARGTVLCGGDDPYRLDYELDTAAGLVTRRLLVRAAGRGWSRHLLLTRDQDGEWASRRTAEGEPCGPCDGSGSATAPGALGEALDCELALSPLCHSMPVLRYALHRRAGEHELVVASVALPELTVTATRQRYARAGSDAAQDPAAESDTEPDTEPGSGPGTGASADHGTASRRLLTHTDLGPVLGAGARDAAPPAPVVFECDDHGFVVAHPRTGNRA